MSQIELNLGGYTKAITAALAAAATEFGITVDWTAMELTMSIPSDPTDLTTKVALVAGLVWAVRNRQPQPEEHNNEEPSADTSADPGGVRPAGRAPGGANPA